MPNSLAIREEFSVTMNRTEAPIQRISGSLLRKHIGSISNSVNEARRMAPGVE